MLLLAALLQAGASPTAAPNPLEWYGARIGDPLPPGQGLPADRLWPNWEQIPAPWRHAYAEIGEDGRISELSFDDEEEILLDAPPYRAPATPDERPKYQADGRAAEHYAIARLGPPTTVERQRQGPYEWATLHWDFVQSFVRCDGAKPVFAAPSHEPSGRIASARLQYDFDGVRLGIEGTNAKDPSIRPLTADDGAQRAAECQQQVRAAEEAAHPEERERQRWADAVLYCRDHADLCSLIPGAQIILPPGAMVLHHPCPAGTAPRTVCLESVRVPPTP